MKKNITFTIRCSEEEKEEIAFLCYKLKSDSKERMAEIVLKALRKIEKKESK